MAGQPQFRISIDRLGSRKSPESMPAMGSALFCDGRFRSKMQSPFATGLLPRGFVLARVRPAQRRVGDLANEPLRCLAPGFFSLSPSASENSVNKT